MEGELKVLERGETPVYKSNRKPRTDIQWENDFADGYRDAAGNEDLQRRWEELLNRFLGAKLWFWSEEQAKVFKENVLAKSKLDKTRIYATASSYRTGQWGPSDFSISSAGTQ